MGGGCGRRDPVVLGTAPGGLGAAHRIRDRPDPRSLASALHARAADRRKHRGAIHLSGAAAWQQRRGSDAGDRACADGVGAGFADEHGLSRQGGRVHPSFLRAVSGSAPARSGAHRTGRTRARRHGLRPGLYARRAFRDPLGALQSDPRLHQQGDATADGGLCRGPGDHVRLDRLAHGHRSADALGLDRKRRPISVRPDPLGAHGRGTVGRKIPRTIATQARRGATQGRDPAVARPADRGSLCRAAGDRCLDRGGDGSASWRGDAPVRRAPREDRIAVRGGRSLGQP